MKKSITLAFSIATVLGLNSVYALSLYCVNDGGLSDSQFCHGTPFSGTELTPPIVSVGPVHQNCDIEALDVRFDPSGTIYAASGDNTSRPGHLYQVYGPTGQMFDLGGVSAGDVKMNEIDAISILPSTAEIWGWSQGQGLFVIDPDDLPNPDDVLFNSEEVTDCTPDSSGGQIKARFEIATDAPIEIEDVEWNFGGTILYAVENVHDNTHDVDSHGAVEGDAASDRDYENGVKLWAYFKDQIDESVVEVCTDLMPAISAVLGDGAEIEGLEALPRTYLGKPATTDTLVLTFHGPSVFRYAVINKPKLFPPGPLQTPCTLQALGEISTNGLNDIEGLGLSPTLAIPRIAGTGSSITEETEINPAEWENFVGAAMQEDPIGLQWAAWTEEETEEE